LFAGCPEQAGFEQLAGRTHEQTDFLVNIARVDHLPGQFSGTVTYHDSCSGLRELGIKQQPRTLLACLPGVELREMQEPETCCGFGGTFSVKFGEISARMADNKCAHIGASAAGTIVAGDLGCLLNIEGRLRRRGDDKSQVLHIAEILADGIEAITAASMPHGPRLHPGAEARAADQEGIPARTARSSDHATTPACGLAGEATCK
jgi:L-lactate dehydrogenase complex protein LldE